MLTIPFMLLVAHYLGDFRFQSDWMATQKSKNWYALSLHASTYSLFFIPWGFKFWLITLITHFLTDAVTSRITAKLWFFTPLDIYYNIGGNRYQMYIPAGGNRHEFFNAIGADQLFHYMTLMLTFMYLEAK